VTASLLSPQYFNYIRSTFTDDLISISQAKILLSDIACCSLMRLDASSLDKLLDLMVMIFKWQLFLMSSANDLLTITFRHLQGIGRLMPEQAKMIMIDQVNNFYFSEWNALPDEQRYGIVRKLNKFLMPFNTRISLLIRMSLQQRDGSFVDKLAAGSNEFFRYYIQNLGENIYEKITHFPQCQQQEVKYGKPAASHEIEYLFQQFNVDLADATSGSREIESVPLTSSKDVKIESEKPTVATALDELKKKCRMDEVNQDCAEYGDNFEELLNMLGENGA
jgi:hypothetical protein